MLSFIIPAHNEERCLPTTLKVMRAAADEVGEPYEILVINDFSTDRTGDIAREQGATVIDVQHRLIAATRNTGGRAAKGDVLFFIDADTQINAGVMRAALQALDQPGVAGGGAVFWYDGPIPLHARFLHTAFTAVARLLKLVGGCCLFCRREMFDRVGGFDEAIFAGEDVAFVRLIKRHGRFVIPKERVLTSNRKLDKISLWFILWLLTRLIVRGPKSFGNREELGLWYGPEARQ